jgi:hypothetical protein
MKDEITAAASNVCAAVAALIVFKGFITAVSGYNEAGLGWLAGILSLFIIPVSFLLAAAYFRGISVFEGLLSTPPSVILVSSVGLGWLLSLIASISGCYAMIFDFLVLTIVGIKLTSLSPGSPLDDNNEDNAYALHEDSSSAKRQKELDEEAMIRGLDADMDDLHGRMASTRR